MFAVPLIGAGCWRMDVFAVPLIGTGCGRMNVFAVASHRDRPESPLYPFLAMLPESSSQFLFLEKKKLL